MNDKTEKLDVAKKVLRSAEERTKPSQFEMLSHLNVSDHIQKVETKSAKLSYLSWVWGWSEMKKADPAATREYTMFDEVGPNGELTGRKVPYLITPQGALVECTVTINGISETESLPVMDFKNAAVLRPDMMQINKTRQRAFVKALALHGIGLYIYAGEDFPSQEADESATANAAADARNIVDETQANAARTMVDEIASGTERFTYEQVLLGLERRAQIVGIQSEEVVPVDKLTADQYGLLLRAINQSKAKLASKQEG
ncbi:DUF1071 domain-containing protein [Lacticaseibacillus parakribbianus]|uniref:DUF1071 domain-containing protein n=1 Tax=Lacticaseibacillus parakribbianus TaxID=2970927 RepID=UPI0021CB9085|nr:DUF1071 domain-containing protein [Lacticaseibacillus parakribbianus]